MSTTTTEKNEDTALVTSEPSESSTDFPKNQIVQLGEQILTIVKGTNLEKESMILSAMFLSGYFKDTTSLSKAITKALLGREMGLGLVQSMNSVDVIDGKVAMNANAVRNTAVAAGFSIRTLELTDKVCSMEWSYQDKVLGISEYTWEDATKAGLTNKHNWKAYPKDMLFARCTTRGARMFANQAFKQAVYEPEEIHEALAVEQKATSEADRRAKIAAAEAKHIELSKREFTPEAVLGNELSSNE